MINQDCPNCDKPLHVVCQHVGYYEVDGVKTSKHCAHLECVNCEHEPSIIVVCSEDRNEAIDCAIKFMHKSVEWDKQIAQVTNETL